MDNKQLNKHENNQPENTETIAERVTRLTKELNIAVAQVAACRHQYGNPERATREINESVFKGYRPRGSDPEPIYENVPKTEYGWKRTCKVCGNEQYTAKQKPAFAGMEPDF